MCSSNFFLMPSLKSLLIRAERECGITEDLELAKYTALITALQSLSPPVDAVEDFLRHTSRWLCDTINNRGPETVTSCTYGDVENLKAVVARTLRMGFEDASHCSLVLHYTIQTYRPLIYLISIF